MYLRIDFELTGKNDSFDVAELDDRVEDSRIRLLVSVDEGREIKLSNEASDVTEDRSKRTRKQCRPWVVT